MRLYSTLLLAAIATVYLSSYSSGLARSGVDGTSSGLEDGQKCNSCHNGGNYGTQTSFSLLDAQGVTQTAYRPGESYKIRIDIATSVAPNGYGFQLLMIDAKKAQAGAFGTPPQNTRVSPLNGRNYVEHSRRLSGGSIEIDWTAPAKGTGPIDVYAVGNAVNGNGANSGDEVNETILVLAESAASEVRERAWPPAIAIAQSAGTISITDNSGFGESPYQIQLYDMSGRLLRSEVLAKAGLTLNGLQLGPHVLRLQRGAGVSIGRLLVVTY